MDTLLESLKVEILHRLPLQSLALCKCISKHWLTLITSTPRVFAARHHNELPVTLLFQYPEKQLSKKIYLIKEKFKYGEFNTSTIGESVDVVASCKDLLLCLGRVSSNNYYIVNCITMQWLKLPPVREVPGKLHVGLVCDSDYNNHDRMESWYRVVRLILDLHNNIIVEIFSSDTGEWCEVQMSSRPQQQPFGLESAAKDISGHNRLLLRSTGGVVAFGRMIFWQSSKWSIFGFDPNNCKCYFINLGIGLDEMVDCMGVCNGCLRICMVLRFFDHLELTVLELKDYKEGGMWRSEHMVEFQDMDSSNTWLREIVKKKDLLDYGLRVLAHDPRDGDVVYLEIKQQLIMCNMKKKRLKLIRDIPDKSFYKLGSVYTFVLPWCPTPIPSLPQNITMKERKSTMGSVCVHT